MKKIAVTGPESTGKSALSIELAAQLNTIYVPEIARGYLGELNNPYAEQDLLKIAILQCAAEDEAGLGNPRILVCDTDMLVLKIWSEIKYGRVHPFILNQYRRRKYDLVLLMDIDLPWEDDPLREHPDKRGDLFELYHAALKEGSQPFEIIRGNGPDRTKAALAALQKHRLLQED